MSTCDEMNLSSDNNEKFNEIIKDWKPEGVRIYFRADRDGEVFFSSAPIPDESVKKLSAAHPDMTFTAYYSFEVEDYHSIMHRYEYRGGYETFVSMRCSYKWICLSPAEPGPTEEEWEQLTQKITEVFRRIDPFIPERGVLEIYDYEVMVSAEQGEWKMEATKLGTLVNFIAVYKKTHTGTWEQIPMRMTRSEVRPQE